MGKAEDGDIEVVKLSPNIIASAKRLRMQPGKKSKLLAIAIDDLMKLGSDNEEVDIADVRFTEKSAKRIVAITDYDEINRLNERILDEVR